MVIQLVAIGTWVPFERAKALAELYEVDTILAPILEYVKGDESPPLAPKHATTASARPRKPREARVRKKTKQFDDDGSDVDTPKSAARELTHSEAVPKRLKTTKHKSAKRAMASEHEADTEATDDDDGNVAGASADPMDYEYHSKSYAHRLLQYFMSNKTNIPSLLNRPPHDLDINVIIDDEGHTSLHWAAAMARIKIVKLLIENGADIYRVNYSGQTALMRSVLFSNNFDLKTFDSLLDLLGTTIFNIDKKDQTVFHHIAAMSDWKGKIYASRYYMESMINKFKSNQSELISILNVQDINGDTALTIAAKIGNRRLVKLLIDAGASTEVTNEEGMTPKDYFGDIDHIMTVRHGSASPGTSSPQSETNENELDTKELIRTKIEAMFNNMTNNEDSAPSISEAFDEFAESYEKDLVNKERLLDKKKIELSLYIKRLDETKRILDSAGLSDEDENIKIFMEQVKRQTEQVHEKYRKWVAYSQKQNVALLEERFQNNENPPSPPQQYTIEELEATAHKLAEELKHAQSSRKENMEKLVELRCSIPPKKYQDYKRLISTSCNVPYENVDMMLEPLLVTFEVDNTEQKDTMSTQS